MTESLDAANDAALDAPKPATTKENLSQSSPPSATTASPNLTSSDEDGDTSSSQSPKSPSPQQLESLADRSNSTSRTASTDSDDADTVADEAPAKQDISPVSSAGQTNTAPLDIIHSVANRPAVPPLSPISDATAPTPRSSRFSIFSPRNGKSLSPLRRLFSPRRFSATSLDRDSESTITNSNFQRRLKFVCSCFASSPSTEESLQELDYAEHIKTLEPTYEPEPPLLPSPAPHAEDRICLVLDLDETLVHSSFTPLPNADFEIPLDMQGEIHTVYVKKRPGVDRFLSKASEWYEIVIFTASLALYANPVVDLLDPQNLVQLRLYREHCVLIGGCYVKDIAKLGRDLKRTVIIDNSPLSYVLQPENAIPISAFFTDDNDRELDKTLELLEHARNLEDVRKALTQATMV